MGKHWRVFRGLLLVIWLVVFGGCAVSPLPVPERPIALLQVPVCGKPSELTSSQNMWAYSRTMRLVPATDAIEFQHAASTEGRFYIHAPNADPANSITLPIPHNRLPCSGKKTIAALEKPSRVNLIAGRIVPIAPPAPCKLLDKRAFALLDPVPEGLRSERSQAENVPLPNKNWIAQSAHTLGQGIRSPSHPDPKRLAQDEARKQAVDLSWESGNKFGSAIAGIESGLETLSSHCSRFDEDLRENPDIVEDLQKKIAKTLDDIALPPQYTDPELQGLATGAFSRGFESGFGFKKLQFLALNTTATVAIILFPSVYVIAETVGAKAIRLALQRVRSIPVYVPAMTNGGGFFLKLPKAIPANVNGPALPVITPPPIVTPPPPPPFGNLSRAAQFGILTERQMAKAIAGTGLERHHLIEQRFLPKMGGDPRMNLTIAVTEAEHQVFTNKWREKIPYGNAGTFDPNIRRREIIAAARKIYENYPVILKALDL